MERELAERNTRQLSPTGAMIWPIGIMVLLFALTHSTWQNQNDLSRLLAVDSLARRGEFYLDNSPYAQHLVEREGRKVHFVVDLVYNKRDGRLYSSKPPVLTMILAAVVWGLNLLGAGLAFTGRGIEYLGFVFLQTWVVIGTVSACTFYAFRKKVGQMLQDDQAHLVTALTLGGTLFLTYSVTMNHHTFTAGLVLMAFFLLGMAEAEPEVSHKRALGAGFLMGLASVVDIGPGFIYSVAFGVYLLAYHRSLRTAGLFALGGLAPLLVHSAVQHSIWGSILPVQMIPGTKDYPYSVWNVPAFRPTRIPSSRYWFLTLFSTRGLFVLSPVLLLGVAALLKEIICADAPGRSPRQSSSRWWRLSGQEAGPAYVALTVLFGVLFLCYFYGSAKQTNFGGACYGFRWYIGFTPLLAFYAARSYRWWHENALFRKLFIALGLISVALAFAGTRQPWAYMEENPHFAVQVLMLLRGF